MVSALNQMWSWSSSSQEALTFVSPLVEFPTLLGVSEGAQGNGSWRALPRRGLL